MSSDLLLSFNNEYSFARLQSVIIPMAIRREAHVLGVNLREKPCMYSTNGFICVFIEQEPCNGCFR